VSKRELLKQEGVRFDAKGVLIEKWRFWSDFNLDKL
jgi:methylated-DNA-[protein]-cysteine S-methyltransferase